MDHLLEPCRTAIGWTDGAPTALAWALILGNTGICLVYAIIACVMLKIAMAERNPFPDLALLFSGFIAACGLTHFMKVVVLFWPRFLAEAMTLWLCLGISAIAAYVLIGKYQRMVRWDLVLDALQLTRAKDVAELKALTAALEQRFSEIPAGKSNA